MSNSKCFKFQFEFVVTANKILKSPNCLLHFSCHFNNPVPIHFLVNMHQPLLSSKNLESIDLASTVL